MEGNLDICFSVEVSSAFDKDIEYFVRKKKYYHLPSQINALYKQLQVGSFTGDVIKNLKLPQRSYVYKARMANIDTKSGKSNGYRIIYFVDEKRHRVVLATIYYKKEKSNILEDEILAIINDFI